MPVKNDEIFDLYTGAARTFEAICRQLIERNAVDRDVLLSDLMAAQADLSRRGAGLAASLPAAVYSALGGQAAPEEPGNDDDIAAMPRRATS
jgi:hypothetical protein